MLNNCTCGGAVYTTTCTLGKTLAYECAVCLKSSTAFKTREEAEKDWNSINLPLVDLVNSPNHYTQGNIEVITVINDWKMCFSLGNAIKYIARAKYKRKEREDISKAIWYLNNYLSELSDNPKGD